MKKKVGAIGLGALLLLCFIMLFKCLDFINPGYVGVIVSMNGGARSEPVEQGIHFIPPTAKVREFTVGNEQLILSKDSREGSVGDDSFAVATSDNANIDISFQMSYRFIKGKVVEVYKNFKGMDGEDIINERVRTVLKAKISEITTDYSMMDLYSGNRDVINRALTSHLNEELGAQFGIEVIDASIIDVHPDEALQKTINDRVTAMQKKAQAKAEQETIKVQNETKILQAEADAKEAAIKAQAEAEVTRIKAEAEATANKKIAESLTAELVEKNKIDKWDGKLPQVSGGNALVDFTK